MSTNVANLSTAVNPSVGYLATDRRMPLWQQLLMANKLPNHLRAWREAAELSLDTVAEAMGTDKTQVSRLERGERRLTVPWMQRFATAIHRPPEALLKAPPPIKLSGQGVSGSQNRDQKEILTISGNPPSTKEDYPMERHEIDLIVKYRMLDERGRNYVKLVVNDEVVRAKRDLGDRESDEGTQQ